MVWNQTQKDFLKRFVNSNSSIEVVGSIDFSDGNKYRAVSPKSAIAVFDFTPARKSFVSKLGLTFNYYTPQVSKLFLQNIHKVAQNNNFLVLYKQKRESPNAPKSYLYI